MKRLLAFTFVFAFLFTSNSWAQKRPVTPRSKTDAGYWYVRTANPQRISHYMRQAGLLYLEETERDHNAEVEYAGNLINGISDNAAKEAVESEDNLLQMFEDRMNINIQAPSDKDFLAVLKHTSMMGRLAGSGLLSCSTGIKPKAECDLYLSRYVSCKIWMKESIDSGVFDDSWHEGCYGDWAEEHK